MDEDGDIVLTDALEDEEDEEESSCLDFLLDLDNDNPLALDSCMEIVVSLTALLIRLDHEAVILILSEIAKLISFVERSRAIDGQVISAKEKKAKRAALKRPKPEIVSWIKKFTLEKDAHMVRVFLIVCFACPWLS